MDESMQSVISQVSSANAPVGAVSPDSLFAPVGSAGSVDFLQLLITQVSDSIQNSTSANGSMVLPFEIPDTYTGQFVPLDAVVSEYSDGDSESNDGEQAGIFGIDSFGFPMPGKVEEDSELLREMLAAAGIFDGNVADSKEIAPENAVLQEGESVSEGAGFQLDGKDFLQNGEISLPENKRLDTFLFLKQDTVFSESDADMNADSFVKIPDMNFKGDTVELNGAVYFAENKGYFEPIEVNQAMPRFDESEPDKLAGDVHREELPVMFNSENLVIESLASDENGLIKDLGVSDKVKLSQEFNEYTAVSGNMTENVSDTGDSLHEFDLSGYGDGGDAELEDGGKADSAMHNFNENGKEFSFDKVFAEQSGAVASRADRLERIAQAKEISKQIVKSAMLKKNLSGYELNIKLEPSYLGELKISIADKEEGFVARIVTDNSSTKEVLAGNLPMLRESFSEIGIELDDVEVLFDGEVANDGNSFSNEGEFGKDDTAKGASRKSQKAFKSYFEALSEIGLEPEGIMDVPILRNNGTETKRLINFLA